MAQQSPEMVHFLTEFTMWLCQIPPICHSLHAPKPCSMHAHIQMSDISQRIQKHPNLVGIRTGFLCEFWKGWCLPSKSCDQDKKVRNGYPEWLLAIHHLNSKRVLSKVSVLVGAFRQHWPKLVVALGWGPSKLLWAGGGFMSENCLDSAEAAKAQANQLFKGTAF